MDKRPVNLNLLTVKLPITSISSITHRISGVILLGAVLILLWMLDLSLESEQGFEYIQGLLDTLVVKLIIWAILAALAYHFIAGTRHLIMDLGFWETLKGGMTSAWGAIFLALIVIVLAGVWLW